MLQDYTYGSNEPELKTAFAKNCQTSEVQLRTVEDLLNDMLPRHSRTSTWKAQSLVLMVLMR